MRALGKVLGSVFAIAATASLLSFNVMAAPPDIIYDECTEDYDYQIFSDGDLVIFCKEDIDEISLENVNHDYFDQITEVTFVISDLDHEGGCFDYIEFDGDGCNATKISLFNQDRCFVFWEMAVKNFPKLAPSGFNFPANTSIVDLTLSGMDSITSFDFVNTYKVVELCIENCSNIGKELTIKNNILETFSLINCNNVEKVNLLSTIANYVHIDNCIRLSDIKLPETCWTFVAERCKGLKYVDIPASVNTLVCNNTALKTLTLPQCTDLILNKALQSNPSLESIAIPVNTQRIFYNAFEYCKSLKDIYYAGTEEQFEKIIVTEYFNGYIETANMSIKELFDGCNIHYNFATYDPEWARPSVGGWRYFDKTGAVQKGWKKIDGKYYYFDLYDGSMYTDWLKLNDVWYYFGSNGTMRTGWQLVQGSWYYFGADGAMRKSWQQISGTWYYFGDNGIMTTGWQKIKGTWYYFNNSGSMVTGWQLIDELWYYFSDSGAMYTGWKQSGSTWYYLTSSGKMAKGSWQSIGGKWYYFDDWGAMQTGWLKLSGSWYYLDPSSGAMVTGTKMIDGKTYNFDSSGCCTNP